MVKSKLNKLVKDNIYLILLLSIVLFTIFSTSYFSALKKSQEDRLLYILDNTFFKKSINHLITNLNPRFINLNFRVSDGDSFEKILNKLEISKGEKEIAIKNLSNFKFVKSLFKGQNISFKLDNANSSVKIIEISIEQSKTKKYVFSRINDSNKFNYKESDKLLKKVIVFKESEIINTLYYNVSSNIIMCSGHKQCLEVRNPLNCSNMYS